MEQQQQNQVSVAPLAAAYTKAFAEISNVVKNATNPHFGSDYATLDAVLDTVRPVFAKHGLAVYQAPGKIGELAGNLVVSVVTVLMHESGLQMQVETQVPLGPKATAQAAGGAITYARRYALAAIAGIAQVDDDGNAVSAKKGDDGGDLLAAIETAETSDELQALYESVQESGDDAIVKVFVAKRTKLRKAKK